MTRTRAREAAVRLIYAQAASLEEPDALVDEYFEPEHLASLAEEEGAICETPDEKSLEYIRKLVRLSTEHRLELDDCVRRHSHSWRPERITRTAMAVLRCALTEMMYMDEEEVTPGVAINEAVELAKNFEEPETVAFINGVLGGFMREEYGAADDIAAAVEAGGESAN